MNRFDLLLYIVGDHHRVDAYSAHARPHNRLVAEFPQQLAARKRQKKTSD